MLKKGLIFILFLFCLSGLLVAGGQQDSVQEQKEVNIVWWTHQRHDMDFMREMVEKFNVEHVGKIHVEYVVQTEEYPRNLELAFQSKQAPDIFSGKNDAKYYNDRKMAYPLNEFLTDDIKSRYGNYLNIDVENSVDGKVYSLANAGVNFRLVYNKELFEKAGLPGPPESFEQMVEYAIKISEVGKDDKQFGFALNLKNPWSSMFRSLDQIAKLSGVWPYDYKKGAYDFTGMKPIMQGYKKMMDEGAMFPGVISLDIDPLRSQFAEGNIGMYISGNWEAGVFNSQFPAKIKWAAVEIPALKGEVKGKSWVRAGRWQFISSQSKHKEEAWTVLEWFHKDQVLMEYHEKGLGYSVVPSIVAKAGTPDIPGAEYFNINPDREASWPAAPHELGMVLEGKPFHDVITAYMLGAVSLNDAIDDLNYRYNRDLKKSIDNGIIDSVVISAFDPMKL